MASSARIDELRKKFDENPRRYFAPLANEYRKAGDPEQAIFICEEYLPQQPGHMSGHIVYGQALFELTRHDEARTVFETALSLDPENLIALRHLGDIARQGGDATTARMWYQRVLEADPRNEEIAQLMLSLLNDDQPAPAAAALSPTPLSTSIIAGPIEIEPTSIGAAEPELDVEKSIEQSIPIAAPMSMYEETRRVSPHAPKESDLLDLDDFDLGGVPLSELRAASATPTYQPAQPFDPSQPFDESKASGISMPDMIDHGDPHGDAHADEPTATDTSSFDSSVEEDAASFEAGFIAEPSVFDAEAFGGASGEIEKDDDTPIGASSESNIEPFVESLISTSYTEISYRDSVDAPAIEQPIDSGYESTMESDLESSFEPGLASAFDAAPEPIVDSATDLHLGLTDDGTAQPTVGDESDTTASTMAGLETFEAGVFTAAAVEPLALETESFFETPPVGDDPPGSYVASELAQSALAEAERSEVEQPEVERSAAEAASDAWMDFDAPVVDVASLQPVSDQAEAEAHVPEADVPDFEDESFNAVGTSGSPESVDTVDTFESFEATTNATLPSESVESSASLDDESAETPTVEVFVTETMAQLYLEQGHLESALVIYRKLVEQRPADEDLAARMDAIEERLAATATESIDDMMYVDESLAQLAAEVAPARSYGGPTIREFLSGFVMRVPVDNASATRGVDVLDDMGDDPVEEFGAFEPEPEAEPQYTAPASEAVSGSLDMLFSGADAGGTDAEAAETLAQAFASEMPSAMATSFDESEIVASVAPNAAALEGAPAHRASDELSLDHVFKTNTPPRSTSESDGFSFDQFFSDEVAEGAAETHAEPSAAAQQGPDDIAQFNAWLNGLKKS